MTVSPQLILTSLPGLPLVSTGDDLSQLILDSLLRISIHLEDGDLLAIAQKIVSKAEGRLVYLSDVHPTSEAKHLAAEVEKDPRLVELILRESHRILRTRPGLIIVEHRLGFVCANAGIDTSNVQGEEGKGECVLMLPEDPDDSAESLRSSLSAASGVALGILIVDSHGRAWREGSVGVAIGVAGLPALVDLRGEPDIFGKLLQSTRVGLADELAAAASVIMGQAAEMLPVVHIRGVPYALREGAMQELLRPKERDLFR